MNRHVRILATPEAAAEAAARWLAERIGDGGSVALSGGSTPKRCYELLAGLIDVSRVEWYLVDERFVPPVEEGSNERMIRCALGPRAEVRGMWQATNPHAAAHGYDLPASFDAALLGMGVDGHTAGLFPGSAALSSDRLVEAVERPDGRAGITLTLPGIFLAQSLAFLVTGEEKSPTLARVLAGEDLPATRVVAARPDAEWFVDVAAAGMLAP